MQPRRLRCFLRRGALQIGYGRVSAYDTWWARVIDASWRSTFFRTVRFRGAWSKAPVFLRGSSQAPHLRVGRDGLDPDAIVLVFIGTNDYGLGRRQPSPVGRWWAAQCPRRSSRSEERERRDLRTCGGSYRGFPRRRTASMLSRIRTSYPDADMWCCTLCPWQTRRRTGARHLHSNLRRGADVSRMTTPFDAASEHGCPWSISRVRA